MGAPTPRRHRYPHGCRERGLVRRHGPDAVDDACRRALDAEVIDVGLIERIVTRGGGEQLPLLPKPPAQASRFVHDESDFAVRRPS